MCQHTWNHADYLNAAAAAALAANDEASRMARKRALSPQESAELAASLLRGHSPIDSAATASLQLGAALAARAASAGAGAGGGGSPSSSGSFEQQAAAAAALHSHHHLQQLQAHLLARSSPVYLSSPQNSLSQNIIHSAAAVAAAAAIQNQQPAAAAYAATAATPTKGSGKQKSTRDVASTADQVGRITNSSGVDFISINVV